MTAREKFKIGDRVRMSPNGIACHAALGGISNTPTTGRVTGFAHADHPYAVAILRDGRKIAVVVHADRWEIDGTAASTTADSDRGHRLELLRAAIDYVDTIQDDDRAEFMGKAVLHAAVAFVRSLSKADRERLGR